LKWLREKVERIGRWMIFAKWLSDQQRHAKGFPSIPRCVTLTRSTFRFSFSFYLHFTLDLEKYTFR
jgi:hypothetical protein